MINLKERFESLTQREKIIVTATAIVGILACWDSFFWSSIQVKQTRLEEQFNQLNQRLAAQRQAVFTLQSGKVQNPNLDNETELAALTSQLSSMQRQMASEGGKFIPPRLMAKALSDILQRNQQLTLISLDSLPVTTLQSEKNLFFPVFKHGITMTLSGNYLDTLAYLKALESLSWQIYWDSIHFQVKIYPVAETTIKAYTLSLEESWLGV